MKRFRLLTSDEIECRISVIQENGLSLLLYKDARCDMNILDETVGEMNWKKSYSRDNRNCTVSLWDAEKKEWIGKEDTGTESNTESEKGLASDSFKRACFNWGIGRELYTAPFIWIPADKCKIYEERGKLKCRDRFDVLSITYDDTERISGLQIVKEKTGEVVYTLGQKNTQGATEDAKIENVKIGKTKAKALQKEIEENGVDPSFAMTLFKVKNLADLTEKQHKNILDHMDQLVETYQQAFPEG